MSGSFPTFFYSMVLVLILHFSIKHYLLFLKPRQLARITEPIPLDNTSQDIQELRRWNQSDGDATHLYEEDEPVQDSEMLAPVEPVVNQIKKSLKETLLEYADTYHEPIVQCQPIVHSRSTMIKKNPSFGEWDKFFQM